VPFPLLTSAALAASSACAFDGLDSNPLPSPPLSAAFAVGLRNPGAPPPPPLAVTVRFAVRLVLPNVAVSVTTVVLATDVVATLNAALVAPLGTVTLVGADAAVELSLSDTANPPLGAAALNVTVPVEDVPPATVVGLRLTAESVTADGGEFTVNVANFVVPFSAAVRVTDVVPDEGNVVMVKLALVAPAGTVTLAGTLAVPGS
jgi:hypothetical protein